MTARAVALITIAMAAACDEGTPLGFGAPCTSDSNCSTGYACDTTGLCAPPLAEGEGEEGEGEGEGEEGEGEGEGEGEVPCGGVAVYRVDFESPFSQVLGLKTVEVGTIDTPEGTLRLGGPGGEAEAAGLFDVAFDGPIRVQVSVIDAGNGVSTFAVQPFGGDNDFEVFFEQEQGELRAGSIVDGEREFADVATYDPGLHTWWQIRREGQEIVFETAGPDESFVRFSQVTMGNVFSVVRPVLRFESVNSGGEDQGVFFDDLGGGGPPARLCTAGDLVDPLDDPDDGPFAFAADPVGCIVEESLEGVQIGLAAGGDAVCALRSPAQVAIAGARISFSLASPLVGNVAQYKLPADTAIYLSAVSPDGDFIEAGIEGDSLYCLAYVPEVDHFDQQFQALSTVDLDASSDPIVVTMEVVQDEVICDFALGDDPNDSLATITTTLPPDFIPAPAAIELRAEALNGPALVDTSAYFTGVNAP